LAGCAGFDPHNLLSRQPLPPVTASVPVEPPPAGLDAGTRLAAIEFVWTTIRDRHVDAKLNGVDWVAARAQHEPKILSAGSDREFWERLDQMVGELRDSHTRVHSPAQLEDQQRYRSVSLGMGMREVNGRYFLTSVAGDSDAWWLGARSGMELIRWDGEPFADAYARALAQTRDTSTEQAKRRRAFGRLSSGEADTRVQVTVQRFDGTALPMELKRRAGFAPPTYTIRRLPDGSGYIRFTSWVGGLTERLVAAVREFQDAPAIIFDLRDNGGGSATMVETLAQELFRGEVDSGVRVTRTGRPIALAWNWIPIFTLDGKIKGRSDAYAGKIFILVNDGSASASELFAGGLQALGRAQVIGTQTCGCLLGYFGYARVPGGGGLAYSEMGFRTASGAAIEREGVRPDILVEWDAEDIRQARDRVLEAAMLAARE
jgi:carboxyl-terminal processing protease